jgi:hypothetical protein
MASTKAGRFKAILEKYQIPFALAVISALIGVVVFWENHHEGFDTNDDARLNTKVPTKSGYGIYLSLTNSGSPPAVIRDARLIVPGSKKNLPIGFYLADTTLLDDYATDPSRIRAERQLLPIAIDPHSSRTVVLLADPDALNDNRADEKVIQDQLAFCSYVKSDDPNALRQPDLKLGMKWNGLILAGSITRGLADPEHSVDVSIAGNKLSQPSWRAGVVGPVNRPQAVILQHRLAEAHTGGLAKMAIYGRPGEGVIYDLERPLVGNRPTPFRLPALERDRSYLVAFSLAGDVVVSGRLPVPTPKRGYDLARPNTGFCSTRKMQEPLPADIAEEQQPEESGE